MSALVGLLLLAMGDETPEILRPPMTGPRPKPRDSIKLGEDAARKRPKHAVLISEIILHSTYLDIEYGITISCLLGPNAGPAMAMFESIRNATAALDTVEAVVRQALPNEDAELFVDVLRIAGKAQKDRHRFAHWAWAYVPSEKDVLYLAPPELIRMISERLVGAVIDNLPTEGPPRRPLEMRSYTLTQLEGIGEKIANARGCLALFHAMALSYRQGNGETLDAGRRALLAQPAIAELHKSRELNRRNRPTAPKRQPRKSPKASPQKARPKRPTTT